MFLFRQRPFIPEAKISWLVEWPEYTPNEYTSKSVLAEPIWADKVDTSGIRFNCLDELIDRRSHMGLYKVVDQRPLNPIGRTGLNKIDPVLFKYLYIQFFVFIRHNRAGTTRKMGSQSCKLTCF